MSSLLKKIFLPNKITVLLCLLVLFLPEKSAFAEELNPNQIAYYDVQIPNTTNGFKSYMSYRAISKTSAQGVLQASCITDQDGFRRYGNRYVIAVGTGVGGSVGTFVDLILTNGTIIPCVIGDYKQNIHTDKTNLVGLNGCVSEMIVDTEQLITQVRRSGDASTYNESWNSKVATIRVYQ